MPYFDENKNDPNAVAYKDRIEIKKDRGPYPNGSLINDAFIDVISEYENAKPSGFFNEELAIAQLILDGVLGLGFIHMHSDSNPKDIRDYDGQSMLMVNCSDMFAWACSDAEPVSGAEEVEELWRMHKKDREWGAVVWCCKHRNQKPQRPVEEMIKRAGVWDLDAMGIGANTIDSELHEVVGIKMMSEEEVQKYCDSIEKRNEK